MTRRRAPWLRRLGTGVVLLAALAGRALAHGGTLRGAARESLAVPTWLFLLTGGGAVGASFLLAGFVTDRGFVRAVHARRRALRVPAEPALRRGARAAGVAGLLVVVAAGLLGPPEGLRNPAVLVVWVGWWAGFAATTYLVGNAWPALNPWRTIAARLPSLGREYPERAGAWPAVAGLLGLVWLEVVSPLAAAPRLLAGVVLAYTAVTLAGAATYGDRWFDRVDPVARTFRHYGRVAPVANEGGFVARLPGAALAETRLAGAGEVAFVVALLWGTTYDGLVTTPAWRDLAGALVDAGASPAVLYPAALLAGFGLFLGAYRAAARLSRRTAATYLAAGTIARRFAPPLLAIAAGYHLAHFLGYLISLAPALVAVLLDPLSPPAEPPVLALPGWFGGLELGVVLAGHLLAIWIAHAVSFEVFPGRLQAIRSQYPFVVVMVGYTVTALWIVSQPSVPPPYV